MDDDNQRRYTVPDHSADSNADVHVVTTAPDALVTWVRQLQVRQPDSLSKLIQDNRARLALSKEKQLPVEIAARVYFGVSVALVAFLFFLVWMVSGPIKFSILLVVTVLWWVFVR